MEKVGRIIEWCIKSGLMVDIKAKTKGQRQTLCYLVSLKFGKAGKKAQSSPLVSKDMEASLQEAISNVSPAMKEAFEGWLKKNGNGNSVSHDKPVAVSLTAKDARSITEGLTRKDVEEACGEAIAYFFAGKLDARNGRSKK